MPRRFTISISGRAERDLDQIADYIFTDSPQNARSVKEGLRAEIRSLEVFPSRNKVFETNPDPSEVVHAMAVPPFSVYYRIIDEESLVEILAVRHGARDWPPKFFG